MAKTVIQKDWYSIVSPEIFGQDVVGETPAEEPELVVGRTIKVGLRDLVPGTDRHYMDVFLKVEEIEGDRARTELVGHKTSKEYISRMIGRRSERIDIVEDLQTSDGKSVRVKIVATTIRSTKSSKVKSVRRKMEDVLESAASDNNYHDLMESIFRGDLQRDLKKSAKKIYPLRDVEFRMTELQES